MTKTEQVATSILRPINPTVIIILGLYTIVWGLWIINPFWTVFTTAPLYSAMASIAVESVWGAIAITAGTVITRGAMKPKYKNIQMGAFISFFHWFVISILYFMGDWQNTGGITALTFATYSAIIWVNIKVNKKYYELRE